MTSERADIARISNSLQRRYTICWDPLDGSSIVDNNWAVGTIIGVWGKETGLIGATGRDQKTSLVALYGPRTTVVVLLDDGVYEFTYGCTPEGCMLSDGTYVGERASRENENEGQRGECYATPLR